MARKRVKKAECPNCGFKFSEINNYCPHCGQENHTHKLPIRHFLLETLEGLFHFDTKIVKTIRDLFIPGRIIINYNQNKRARYVPPIRLYIFISFIFFLLLSESPEAEKREGIETENKENQFELNGFMGDGDDTTGNYLIEQIKASPHPDDLIDTYLKFKYDNLNWFNKNLYRNLVKFNTGQFEEEELLHKLYKSISYSMFFLMPIFALYLFLIYWRKKLFYSEHLIFAINFHSLTFIVLCIWLLLSMININIDYLFLLIILLYFLLFLRNVYNQSWVKTIMKFLLLGTMYSISICIVLLIGIVMSIFI